MQPPARPLGTEMTPPPTLQSMSRALRVRSYPIHSSEYAWIHVSLGFSSLPRLGGADGKTVNKAPEEETLPRAVQIIDRS